LDFHPKKSGRTNFRPELFWIFKISTGKFLGFSTFAPTFFGFFNFRGKNFPAKRFSRPKKVGVSGFHGQRSRDGFTTGMSVS